MSESKKVDLSSSADTTFNQGAGGEPPQVPPRTPSSGGGTEDEGRRAAPTVRTARAPLRLYKSNQGTYVRWGTAAAAGIISLGFAYFVSEQLTMVRNQYVVTLVPVGVLVMMALIIFRLVGQNRTVVDFLVATEGEMKKVNWSTRREVLGATRVVIVTVFAIGLLLFVVDLIFIAFFESIGVLRIGLLAQLFGGGGEGTE